MPPLRYLTAEQALTGDGDAVLGAAASTRGSEHAAVMGEVAALLAWCKARHPAKSLAIQRGDLATRV
jgi:hypothetical protein